MRSVNMIKKSKKEINCQRKTESEKKVETLPETVPEGENQKESVNQKG